MHDKICKVQFYLSTALIFRVHLIVGDINFFDESTRMIQHVPIGLRFTNSWDLDDNEENAVLWVNGAQNKQTMKHMTRTVYKGSLCSNLLIGISRPINSTHLIQIPTFPDISTPTTTFTPGRGATESYIMRRQPGALVTNTTMLWRENYRMSFCAHCISGDGSALVTLIDRSKAQTTRMDTQGGVSTNVPIRTCIT